MYAGIQTTLHKAHFKGNFKPSDFIGGSEKSSTPASHGSMPSGEKVYRTQSVEDQKAMLGAMFEMVRTPEAKRKSAEKIKELLSHAG